MKHSADIYKRNFKKVVKVIVDDVWKNKGREAVEQYKNGSAVANGKATFDTKNASSFKGIKYVEQEKKRLSKIVQGKTTDSIVGHRSSMYDFRAKATDLGKIEQPLPWSTTKVSLSNKSNIYKKKSQADFESKRDQRWLSTLSESGIKLSTVTPGPGAYATGTSSARKGYSFGKTPKQLGEN